MEKLKIIGMEIGVAVLSTVVLLVSLVFIQGILDWAFEVHDVIEGITAVVFGIIVLAAGVCAVGFTAGLLLQAVSEGWMGMLSGWIPEYFSDRKENVILAWGNIAFALVSISGGVLLFRLGVKSVTQSRALMGLLFVLSGILFGLIPLVPRVYFARKKGKAPIQKKSKSFNTAILVAIAVLGIGLSMSVNTFIISYRLSNDTAVMAYGDWIEGETIYRNKKDIIIKLVPKNSRMIRFEYYESGGCPVTIVTEDGKPVKGISWEEVKRLKIEPKKGDHPMLRFYPEPGKVYRVKIGKGCAFQVRYLHEPGVKAHDKNSGERR
ncbi:MAG: hypothetical protein GY754_32815 [bacterium]|nr:hypothetical protein [bacterium]